MEKKITFILLLLILCKSSNYAVQVAESSSGDYMNENKIIEALLESPLMLRIKDIDQHGPGFYFNFIPGMFSRFDHCVGVYELVKNAGGSLKEQAAALLHDTSHGPFSHVMDYVRKMPEKKKAYQDEIHLWFLSQMGIQKYLDILPGWTLEDFDPDQEQYKRLEQPLPDLCADRIQYILHTGILFNSITPEQKQFVLDALHFDNDTWYLNDLEAAKILGKLSLHFTKNFWGAPWNIALNHYFAQALMEAVKLNLISDDDLHFGTDRALLTVLENADSAYIRDRLAWCQDIHNSFFLVGENEPCDVIVKPKCRGVNPWIKTKLGLQRLTDIDPIYATEFIATHEHCAQGMRIKTLQTNLAST